MDSPYAASMTLAREAILDPQARERLVRDLVPKVRQTVRWLVGDPRETHDHVHSSLVAILDALAGYRGEASLQTWAQRITYRTTMRSLSRQRRRERVVALDLDTARVAGDNWEDDMARNDLWQRFSGHVQRLPADRRMALLLRVGQGHSVAEIAAITDTPVNTVKGRLSKALAELRKSIGRDHEFLHALGRKES